MIAVQSKCRNTASNSPLLPSTYDRHPMSTPCLVCQYLLLREVLRLLMAQWRSEYSHLLAWILETLWYQEMRHNIPEMLWPIDPISLCILLGMDNHIHQLCANYQRWFGEIYRNERRAHYYKVSILTGTPYNNLVAPEFFCDYCCFFCQLNCLSP